MLAVAALAACSNETRPVGASLPLTPPTGRYDPRIAQYQASAFQISQGGRYFGWYGCAGCHAAGGSDHGPDLAHSRISREDGYDAAYRYIANVHPGESAGYASRIPVEQLWQITAYVRDLPKIDPPKRRRQDADTAREPHDRQGPAAP